MHQHHAGHQHHQNHQELDKRQEAQGGTVVEYVYQTAAKTFDGPVGGYITAAARPDDTSNSDNSNANNDNKVASPTTTTTTPTPTPSPTPTPTPTPTPAQVDDTDTSSTSTSVTTSSSSSTSSPSSTTSSASSTPKKQIVQQATSATSSSSSSSSSLSSSPTSSFIEATSSAAKPSSTAASDSSSNGGGMSSGAKAGLAIGILLAVALLLGLLFFCYRRRRKHANGDYAKADDEKAAYMEGLKRSQSMASTRTTATAPRLSLRPITQFMPDMAARGKAMNGIAPAAAIGAVGGAAGAAASRDHNDPENPFGNHAEVPRKSQGSSEKDMGLPIQKNAAENPFGKNAEVLPQTDDLPMRSMNDDAVPAPLRVRTPTPEAGAVTGGVVAGAAGGLAAAQIAERHNTPKPLNLTPKRSVSPSASSPAVSEFSQSSVPAAAMVNGSPPSNVHRIQLDFKPSMEDELALRAGQLVRLLHEYDDGWALCIRLDRSQQGVAPRTCLSARPVKPRPPPGARGPGPRGPPPGMMGPGQQHPQSPASSRGPPKHPGQGRAPRPYNAAGSQQRSMSPGPYGGGPQRPAKIPTPGSKRRSNSASDISIRKNSPPGPSGLNPNVQKAPLPVQAVATPDQTPSQIPLARKPVPGQAI